MTDPARASSLDFPPPATALPDMPARWSSTDLPFDVAADQFLAAHEGDGPSHDFPVLDLRTWGVRDQAGTLHLQPLARGLDPLPLRQNALSALCARVGVPTDYVKRLPAPLQIVLLNYGLASQGGPVTTSLRIRRRQVAALVSDRYAPFDPGELVDVLRLALARAGLLEEARVRGTATGLIDVLRITFPGRSDAVAVGDVTEAGIDVSTSSFGRSAIHLRGVLYRLKCTNGLRVAEKTAQFSFRHVGDSNRLRHAVFHGVPDVLAHVDGTLDLWRRSIRVAIDDVARFIEQLPDLTEVERARVEAALIADAGTPALPETTSLYSALNALTGSAHQAEPQRRLELESLAGELLRDHGGAS